ncbi:hypothetical protein ACFFKU_15900 [Kineococcus gynurae]|uniref:Uncharacterized protein n=1 Tax=Kineococcus gynurae TaxID=452979 RepID=A0ABV5LXB2_9ACTN
MTDTQQALDAWWADLDPQGRRRALTLAPGAPLPPTLALSLRVRGIHVPAATVGWEADGLFALRRMDVQPVVLQEFLTGIRCAELSSAA